MVIRIIPIVLVLIFIPSSGVLFGQSNSIFEDIKANSENYDGQVRIIQEEPIQTIVEKHQWAKSKQKGIIGYRIRIYSNSGQGAKAGYDRTIAQFAYSYDGVAIHEVWSYPNYKIYVGDFRTESEALKFRKKIERQFTGAFIVKTRIHYPKIELND